MINADECSALLRDRDEVWSELMHVHLGCAMRWREGREEHARVKEEGTDKWKRMNLTLSGGTSYSKSSTSPQCKGAALVTV